MVYGPGETGNDVIGADVEIGRLQNMSKKKKCQEAVCAIDQDGNFAFIAGYTPGGFPYGITVKGYAGSIRSSILQCRDLLS